MEQNKTRSYLLYAFGEILLVVFGILIALQINNWKENRLNRKVSNETLIELQSELFSNLDRLERTSNINLSVAAEAEKFVKKTFNRDSVTQNPGSVFTWSSYTPIKTDLPILEQELSSNQKIIGQDSLKVLLREIQNYEGYMESSLFYLDEFWNGELAPFYVETKSMTGFFRDIREKNPDEVENLLLLMDNEVYRQKVAVIYLLMQPYNNDIRRMKASISKAIKLIEDLQ